MSQFLPRARCFTRYYGGYYGPHWHAYTRRDVDIAQNVRRRLQQDSQVDPEQVEIDVNHSTVVLQGQVHSIVEKRAAGDDARDTPGVINVINNLQVRPPTQS